MSRKKLSGFERRCLVCGKIGRREFGEKTTWLCSRECVLERKKRLAQEGRDEYRKQHPLDMSPLICGICSKEFVPSPLVRYKAKYCSTKCKDRAKRINQKEFHRLNPEWGKAQHRRWNKARKWHGNWWKTLERDAFTCQLCKVVGSEDKIRGSILVHHMDGEGENGANNHEPNNLMTVCYDCHEGLHGISLVNVRGQWAVKGKILERFDFVSLPVLR